MAEQTFLNLSRAPIFCPGCSHEKILRELDRALVALELNREDICIVTDIGCSGFFDVYFDTHAFHGLHGRALTYAAGIKLAKPHLNVIVTMGDGGLGIGGVHLIAACRRNLDLTLLILNNFNFGMTGGQCSATTPNDASLSSGFLNKLDEPLDPSALAITAGAAYVCRCSAYQKDISQVLREAITFKGFSMVEIWGICPGRYTKANTISPKSISDRLGELEPICGVVDNNQRPEFGMAYRREASAQQRAQRPREIEPFNKPPTEAREEVALLGAAGQRIISAGEVLALAGLTAGLQVTQKNEYNVTVLRGPSISELILSTQPIDYNGVNNPTVVVALAEEGVAGRSELLGRLTPDTLVFHVEGLDIPETQAQTVSMNFQSLGVKRQDWALASLALLARYGRTISYDMLIGAIEIRFQGNTLKKILDTISRVYGK